MSSEKLFSLPVCLAGKDLEKPIVLPFLGGKVVVFTRSSPIVGHDNEDAIGVFEWQEEVGVLTVADGLGGLSGGASASRQMIECFRNLSALDSADQVVSCIETVNEDLLQGGSGSGTTVTVLFIQGRKVSSYHVGDSTMLITGRRGRIKLQTVPHSIVGNALADGELDEKTAMQHPDRHVIYNMIGMKDMWIETTKSMQLADLDTVILASDGIWDNLYQEEVIDMMRCRSIEKASQDLVKEASERMNCCSITKPGKPDDLSLILYRPGSLVK